MSYAILPSESVINSYRALQKNAKALADIGAWFKQHPEVLGELPPHTADQLNVEAKFATAAIVAVLLGKHTSDGLRTRVEVSLSHQQIAASPYSSVTGIEPLQLERGMIFHTKFVMTFAEWPLAIASLAYDYVTNNCYAGNYKPEIVAKAIELMDEYLPMHFPGVTVEWLKTIHSLDYLLRNEDEVTRSNENGYNHDAFMRILFAAREPGPTSYIPQDLSL